MALESLWGPTGVILGFQMTIFSWRLLEERKVGYRGKTPWLTPSDYLNLSGMLILVFGIYLLPILDIINLKISKILFGLGVFIFIGQALGTAAHYQLFNITKHRKFDWFPKQEKVVISLVVLIAIAYLVFAVMEINGMT